MNNLLITASTIAILVSCATNSDGLKRIETKNLPTTTIQEATTLATTPKPAFHHPDEGEIFETIVKLCDLAFNSLKCEEDCFSSEANLIDCSNEAKEIGINL
jgi:hypothetical protein